jgi:hypothetical protein
MESLGSGDHPLFVRIYIIFGLHLFLEIPGFVFVFGVSVFVSASVKKYENKCSTSQFRPFPLRFHP